MTGYGLTGPDRDKVSYGPTLQALTGYTLGMAEPEGRPPASATRTPTSRAGHLGALATLAAAVVDRRRTGEGLLIDLAQQETVASLLGPLLELDAAPWSPVGNASQEEPGAPHGDVSLRRRRSLDRDHGVRRRRVARLRGPRGRRRLGTRPALRHARRPRGARRRAGRARRGWTRALDADDAMARLQAAGVAAGRVADAADLCARDPQLAARGQFVDMPTPEGRSVRLDGPGFLLSDTPAAVRGPGTAPRRAHRRRPGERPRAVPRRHRRAARGGRRRMRTSLRRDGRLR